MTCQVSNLNIDKESKESTANTDSKNDDSSDDQISAAEKSLFQKIIRKGLVETTQDIEVQRRDPSSPLYSVKSFEALHLLVFLLLISLYWYCFKKIIQYNIYYSKPALLKGVYAMGFNAPSKIQETALPTLLADP